MNKFRTAAIQVLTEVKKLLHCKEITRIAPDKVLLETDGATPDANKIDITEIFSN